MTTTKTTEMTVLTAALLLPATFAMVSIPFTLLCSNERFPVVVELPVTVTLTDGIPRLAATCAANFEKKFATSWPLGIVAVIWNCCAPFGPVDEMPNVTLNPAPSLVETPAAKSLEY